MYISCTFRKLRIALIANFLPFVFYNLPFIFLGFKSLAFTACVNRTIMTFPLRKTVVASSDR